MRLRTRLSLVMATLLALLWLVGVGLPLAQIRFDKPPSGISYSPLSFQGDNASLFSLKRANGFSWFNLDTSSHLGVLKVANQTFDFVNDDPGIMEVGLLQATPTWSPPSNSGKTLTGIGSTLTTGGSSNLGRTIAVNAHASHAGSGTLTNLIATRLIAGVASGAGAITNQTGAYIVLQHSGSNTVTDAAALRIDINKFTSGPVTTGRGLLITSGFGGVTNKYGVYVEDTSAMNYFGGNVGVGVTSPDDRLDVSTGTITTQRGILSGIATWNAGGVTFTALKANITDTASASASLLLDLQVGSASKFGVRKDGQLTLSGGLLFGTDNSVDIGASGATRPRTVYAGTSVVSPAYTVGATAGASGTCASVTVVNGIVTVCTP